MNKAMRKNKKGNESDFGLSKESALRIIRKHLIQQFPHEIEIQDGIPKSCILYGIPNREPVWTARVTSKNSIIGLGRIICISKITGKIIYDGRASDEG